ncbi:cytochrome P450 family 3 subfamily A [Klebsormidium nitens]|uniref:Cytochrome P450 family 3 subfamily A n=1 Tax=Klebsormidium nitens TaxID=105231 RepID=A0A1Y1HM16_KLENI|nr:cytochrome P450 family 3 subfamily A [Klebsormidium nitens]|eukprot:GAQ78722.1 cytochrome P450 family 3 subfamily A [Klebsormidium nitens]
MAMCWAVLKMAEHPEVQAKVQQELDALVEGEAPTQEELPRLDYLGAVLLETGRLWPAASALLRCSIDTDLKVGGYKVPAGASIVVPIQAIHRSTEAWGDDAREFRPDRWKRTSQSLSGLPGVVSKTKTVETELAKSSQAESAVEHDEGEEAGRKLVDLTYAASLPLVGDEKSRPIFTFGGGPRSCVGRLFSLTEQKIMLATLLKRYRVELVPGQGPFSQSIRGFVARPTPSPEIILVKR